MSVIKGELKVGQKVRFWRLGHGWNSGYIYTITENCVFIMCNGIRYLVSEKNISTEGI